MWFVLIWQIMLFTFVHDCHTAGACGLQNAVLAALAITNGCYMFNQIISVTFIYHCLCVMTFHKYNYRLNKVLPPPLNWPWATCATSIISRRLEYHEILKRGWGELNSLKSYQGYKKKNYTTCDQKIGFILAKDEYNSILYYLCCDWFLTKVIWNFK